MRVAQTEMAAEFIARVPLFAGLDDGELVDLAAATEGFALADGERLFAQNDPGDGAYLVVSGAIVASARTPGDGRRELARVGPGGVIGEFSLLDGGRRSAEAHAEGAVTGFRIDYERFAGLAAGGRPAARAVLERLRAEVARRIAATIAGLGAPAGSDAAGHGSAPGGAPAEAVECARLLGQFPGFDRFRAGDWDAFAPRARRIEARRGTVLADAGQARAALHVVARGSLREMLGEAQLLVHGPGALAGSAAFGGGPWPSRLEAREDAVVFALSGGPPGDDELAARLDALLGPQLTRDLRRLSRVGNRALDPALERA